MAELLAAYPGLDPANLKNLSTPFLLGLWQRIPQVEAIRELATRRAAGRLTTDRLYHLVLAETGDRNEAERAAIAYMAAQMRAGQTPE